MAWKEVAKRIMRNVMPAYRIGCEACERITAIDAKNKEYFYALRDQHNAAANDESSRFHALEEQVTALTAIESTHFESLKNHLEALDDLRDKSWQRPDRLPWAARQFIMEHMFDSELREYHTSLYKGYKMAEMDRLPEFIVDRLNGETIRRELDIVAERNPGKEIVALTDYPEGSLPCRQISLEDVPIMAARDDVVFILLYEFDWNAMEAVKYFEEGGLKYQCFLQNVPMARYFHINQKAYETLKEESLNSPQVHYCPIDFENIFQALEATRELVGDYVEIGTFQGASARAALNYMHRAGIGRKAYFFDTYEGFTYEAAEQASDTFWSGSHTETSLSSVKRYLAQYENANPVKLNIITDKLPDNIRQIAICNIDVDMYDAVYTALKKVDPLIQKHGIVIAEDYGHTPLLAGAQYGVRKFLSETKFKYMPLYFPSGQIMMIKLE